MQLKSTRHAKYNLNYHIVWIPKYRRAILNKQVAGRLETIFHQIANDKNLEMLDVVIQFDHIHLFVSAPPQHSPSLLVNWFKGISSRMYNHQYKDIKIKWTRSYYVGSAGTVSVETIKKYIEAQTCEEQIQSE
jgi:putative transposase